HPIAQAFGPRLSALGLVRFARIAGLSGSACQTLARFSTGEAALLECSVGRGRVLVLASDLDSRWNDFARHATFVPFPLESLRYAARGWAEASDRLVADLTARVLREPGIVTLPGAAAGRQTAVNVDPRETTATRLSDSAFRAALV